MTERERFAVRALCGLFVVIMLAFANPLLAAVAQLDPWTMESSTDPASGNFNINAGSITISAGSQRIVVVAAILETPTSGTLTNFNATLGGTPLTAVTNSATTGLEIVKVWYLPETSIPGGANSLVVSGTYNQNLRAAHIRWGSFSGVDQTTPINDSSANYAAATSVTFGSQVDFVAGGFTFYFAGNGDANASMTTPTGFTLQNEEASNFTTSYIADSGVHGAAGNFGAATNVAFGSSPDNLSAVVVTSLRPAPTTTIGNNLTAEPGASTLCPGDGITTLDNFTVTTSSGVDTINSVTVTLAPAGAFNNIATVSITSNSGTLLGSAVPGSNTVAVALTTNIAASTTATQYLVRITPKTHALMPAVPGASYATTGLVTAVGHTTTNSLAYNDTTSGTITIDNASPANPTWGAIAQAPGQNTLNWTNPGADFAAVLILRRAGAAVAAVPTEGTTYVAGNTIGASTVVYAGAGTSFIDTGLTDGTSYYYAIFARDACINYSSGAGAGPYTYSTDLAITKTATSPVYLADTFTYTLNVTNNGPFTATNVAVTDTLPAGIQLWSATPTQGSCVNGPPIACSLGSLANGATAIVTISVKAKALGTINNTASVTATEPDPNLADNSSTVATDVTQINVADVSVTKTALPASVAVGANVTYTVTVHNNGPDTADAVTMTDPLPVGMTWVSTTSSIGSCSGTVVVSCSLGNMASGATETVTIVATANSGGTKLNQAGIGIDTSTTYDPDPTNDSGTANHTVTGAPPTLPLVCVPAPPIGPAPGALSGVINTYFPGTATVAAGATVIQLGAARALPGNQTPIANGDLLLVIQMQDATINSSQSDSYGDGTAGGGAGAIAVNAGAFEFVRATGAVPIGGGSLTLQGAGASNGLINAYTNADASGTKGQARFQVVRVPQYTSATLSGVTAAPWETLTITSPDGSLGLGTGGILAIDVQGVLTINSGTAASVDGVGFRGGAGRQLAGGAGANTDYRTSSTIPTNGGKGEGNAGTPEWVNTSTGPLQTNQLSDGYPNGSMARGAPGNAGGGSTDGNPAANDQNSGGGGGSNGGAGGTGGHSWNTNLDLGGVGAAVTPAITKLVLGGGGGAGTRNNSPGLPLASGGSSGGGLMVIRAYEFSIAPGALLSANGTDAYDDTENDGGGGGGAGGSVIATVNTGTFSGLTINARGGKGGSAWRTEPAGAFPGARHGPGGGGGGGVVAFTNTLTPPTLDVSGGLPGITTTANDTYFAQPGGVGQTLYVAPGLIPGIGSASDCAIDPTISLLHSPATQSTGGIVDFVATVTNVAPFVSTTGTVTVTITIDAGLAFSSPPATINGWSCSTLGQTITCTRNDALAAQTSYPTITFNATVIAAGPATLSNNTATVSGGGDVNASNNTATDIVGVKAPTLARLRSFEAIRSGSTVYLTWQSSYESYNLGFRVYREVGGKRQLLTPSPIAGSALFVRSRELASGRSYTWTDREPAEGNDVFYWLEDVGIDGSRKLTGPAIPHTDSAVASRLDSSSSDSPLLAGLGSERSKPARAKSGIGFVSREALASEEKSTDARRPGAWHAPTSEAAKVLVANDGWYRVTKAELLSAGFDPGTNPRKLQLLADGMEQTISVDDGGDGVFDPPDSIEFYGVGIDSPYDPTHVYWLVAKEAGKRIGMSQSPSQIPAPAVFPFTLERKDRTIFFSSLTNNGEAENFFGPVISTDPETQDLEVQHFDTSAGGNSLLEVALQGATEGITHSVAVQVNGQDVGTVVFGGLTRAVTTFDVPNSQLHEGTNQLTMVAGGGDDDISVIDYVRLTYPHTYQLDSGALRMTAPGGTRVTIDGLLDTSLRVYDVSRPTKQRQLEVEFGGSEANRTASFGVPGTGPMRLFAFTPDRVSSADAIIANSPSILRANTKGADLVVLANATLKASLDPLVNLRRSQGLVTTIVDVADVYDEFAFGQKTPYAIRDFLTLASSSWSRKPRFVLLAGDASFDPKNYLGMGDFDLLPTKLIATEYMKTDSDDWFADANSDGIPEIAIGRLPARTPTEASTMVGKIVAREAALALNPAWSNSALLVAGSNLGFDFENATSSLTPLLASGMAGHEVFEGTLGATTESTIISLFNSGQLLVNYAGHGSEDVWSTRPIFDGTNAAALTNGTKLPVVVAMTCLNGLFDDLFTESLAETLLKAPNGGAAAVWASSSLTEPEPQMQMNEELFRQLFQSPSITLGEAVNKAKAVVSDPDVRRTWVLFGDPSMRLR